MSHHDKHGALKALDTLYDQLSATEPRRALLKVYDHARQLARMVDELSARSATAPVSDVVRYGVQRLKSLTTLRTPPYDFPADSFLELAVRDIVERSRGNSED